MSNPYSPYFIEQAGSGLVGFQGVKYQRGHGFFGRILSKAVYPLMRFLGKKALSTGADIASDIVNDDMDWKESLKNRMKETGKEITKVGIKKAKDLAQKGSGRRKRKTTIKSKKKAIKREIVKKVKTTKRKNKTKKTDFIF